MKKIFLYSCAIILSLFSSCDKEDNDTTSRIGENGITPDFTFTQDEEDPFTFSFSNLTENASAYRWDFGDYRFYCDKENPTYKYITGGDIDVTLTAINEAGIESTVTKRIVAPEVIVPEITVDGDFSDWEDIDILYDESALDNGGSVKKMKILSSDDFISIYLEGNTLMELVTIDILINTDQDPSTGFTQSGEWPISSGAEILFERNSTVDDGAFYNYVGDDGAWGATSWKPISDSGLQFLSSEVISLNATTNAVEYKFPKSFLGKLDKGINIGLFESTGGWARVANFPEATETASMIDFTFPIEIVYLCE